MYEGHRVKVKVKAAKRREITDSLNVKTSISNNPGSTEDNVTVE